MVDRRVLIGAVLTVLISAGAYFLMQGTAEYYEGDLRTEEEVFGQVYENGTVNPNKTVFKPGERVLILFRRVEGFELVDGRFEYDMDAVLTGSDGSTVFNRTELLGEKGVHPRRDSPVGPNYYFTVTDDLEDGNYTLLFKVYDQQGNESISTSHEFTVEK